MHTILIVDDNQDFLEVMQDLLSLEGYDVLLAPSMQEALVLLDSRNIDVLLTDLRLPENDMTGPTLLSVVREKSLTTVCILVSGWYDVSAHKGFDAYLPKPLCAPVMFKTIRECLASKTHAPEQS